MLDNTTPYPPDHVSWPPETLPRHIAVIMDGNGRWARQRGLGREEGHRAGARAVRLLLEECRALDIPCVTVYAFSKENWQRPAAEIRYLFELFAEFVQTQVPEMIELGISLGMIGERDDLPFATRQALDYAVKRTAGGKDMRFTLALSYSGREEILQAARRLAARAAAGDMKPEDIDEERFRAFLYKPDLPDPDLLIRTSGEMRISNFLLFQCAYTEFYFSDRMWPDFDPPALREALTSFAPRRRRFGRTDEQVAGDAAGPLSEGRYT